MEEIQIKQMIIEDLLCVRLYTKCSTTGTQLIRTEQIMAISTPGLSLLFSSYKVLFLYISCIIGCITICPVAQAKNGSSLTLPFPIPTMSNHSPHILSSLHSLCMLVSLPGSLFFFLILRNFLFILQVFFFYNTIPDLSS